MDSVSIEEAASHLPELIKRVQTGQAVFAITRDGSAVAYITPVRPPKRRTAPHPQLSQIRVNYDPTRPLDKNEWPE